MLIDVYMKSKAAAMILSKFHMRAEIVLFPITNTIIVDNDFPFLSNYIDEKLCYCRQGNHTARIVGLIDTNSSSHTLPSRLCQYWSSS